MTVRLAFIEKWIDSYSSKTGRYIGYKTIRDIDTFVPIEDYKESLLVNEHMYYRFKSEDSKSVIPVRRIKDTTLTDNEFNYFLTRNELELFYRVGG